ncbi:MYXO-CTERM sorting domain-containing protein [Nannocystis sp. SCPEA4]|uniref:MYXO-CTERM sorting domain-containing protein n=1 Tax=Nannocystis sp. SCPEA4 TaxID=2996787 RepID=UPI00226EDA6E|nr:MYXO-CTERM sorting domain-containing protein [Nannocystis sp. SCPEA4]
MTIDAPLDGDLAPTNALVWMSTSGDCGGDPESIHVRVDGEPATLVAVPDGPPGRVFRIEPEPGIGAVIQLEGCPGYASCEEAGDDVYGRVDVSFTAGGRDEQAPAAPLLRDLDYVIEDVMPGACDESKTEPAREWSFVVDGQAAEAPLIYHVSVGPKDGDRPTTSRHVAADGAADLALALLRREEDAGSEVCVTVRTFDLAGNEAAAASSCRELDQNETLDGDGCACSSGSGGSGWSAVWLLLGAWSLRRRRRGR